MVATWPKANERHTASVRTLGQDLAAQCRLGDVDEVAAEGLQHVHEAMPGFAAHSAMPCVAAQSCTKQVLQPCHALRHSCAHSGCGMLVHTAGVTERHLRRPQPLRPWLPARGLLRYLLQPTQMGSTTTARTCGLRSTCQPGKKTATNTHTARTSGSSLLSAAMATSRCRAASAASRKPGAGTEQSGATLCV